MARNLELRADSPTPDRLRKPENTPLAVWFAQEGAGVMRLLAPLKTHVKVTSTMFLWSTLHLESTVLPVFLRAQQLVANVRNTRMHSLPHPHQHWQHGAPTHKPIPAINAPSITHHEYTSKCAASPVTAPTHGVLCPQTHDAYKRHDTA